jgi:hypothetical protein
MPIRSPAARCPICRDPVPPKNHGGGQPRIYCSGRCRQTAARRRRRAPVRVSRRPLPDFAYDAGQQLRKAVERIERIMADDRLRANKEQVAVQLGGHLSYAAETCARINAELALSVR